jgi:nondiscriminating aspartyl-tRNA synthetase
VERTLNIQTIDKINQEVLLKGWIRVVRKHGKLIFFDLRDMSGIIQCVVSQKENQEAFEIAEKLRPEFAIEIKGTVNARPENAVKKDFATGTVEIGIKSIKILAEADTLPFDMGKDEMDLQLETLFDFRPLTLRHPKVAAIFKVQQTIIQSFRKTLTEENFTEIQAPTIVPTATEGGSQVFKVKYYDYDAFLGQSPQFYKQIMVGIFERVFTVAHAYRAEPSVTTRHLSEYVGLDAEFGFISDFKDIMKMVTKVMKNIVKDVSEKNSEELKLFNDQLQLPAIPEEIPVIKLKDAQKVILERTGRDNTKEPDLEPEDERELWRFAKEKFNSDLIFVTHYPTSKRPFYTFPDPENPEFTQSFDLIGLGLEWITGGKRINDYQMLMDHVKKWGNKPEDFEIYLQAFKFGMPPEGGFCLGSERITANILGLKNVREASLFPRDMERVDIKLNKNTN